jgi:hypothetical protein
MISPSLNHPICRYNIFFPVRFLVVTHSLLTFNSLFIATLCYQCKTWILPSHMYTRLTHAKLNVYQESNLTIVNRVKNNSIRQMVVTTTCSIYIQSQKVKWFGHLIRIQDNQVPARRYIHELKKSKNIMD